MQYTPHYNLNLPEGTDIVNPLVQDNPNYSAIDTALYDNKLRVVGTATHVKTGTNHAITLADSDINQFKFVATGDYATGDTFTVDGVTVTPRIADGSTIPNGAFKINSTVLCILDGTMLNITNITGAPVVNPSDIILSNGESVENALVRGEISVTADGVKTFKTLLNELYLLIDPAKMSDASVFDMGDAYLRLNYIGADYYEFCSPLIVDVNNTYIRSVHVRSGNNSRSYQATLGSTPSNTDLGATIPLAGTIYKIYY